MAGRSRRHAAQLEQLLPCGLVPAERRYIAALELAAQQRHPLLMEVDRLSRQILNRVGRWPVAPIGDGHKDGGAAERDVHSEGDLPTNLLAATLGSRDSLTSNRR